MTTSHGMFLTAPNTFEARTFEIPSPAEAEVVVRVAGCGLCHTDVSFATGAVRTRHPLPLILGHEIAGTVVAAGSDASALLGRHVLVPAVIPCGECALCLAGRDTACLRQMMPGNDIHGGFASHVAVPARHLVPLPDNLGNLALADLSVIADAVTTPLQAMKRASVQTGDLVVVVGVGGIGTFAVQIASAFGAAVAAVDVDPVKRARAGGLGAAWVFDPSESDARAVKQQLLKESDVPTVRWRILEMSGTAKGQEFAWTLLPPAGTLGVVGFTMDKPDIRLSNLMALDATAFGSWGCSPRYYREAVELVLAGAVKVTPFIERHRLADAPALFAAPHGVHRPVLVP